MSINWVMTSVTEQGFVRLPNERILYSSPPRTSIQIGTPSSYTGDEPYSLKSETGVIHITNQRIIYLPSVPKSDLKSFSAPILNITDSRVRAPFFGANYWEAMCKPVSGGGLPAAYPILELKTTFREGGAFDFHSTFEQIKERLHNAYTIAQESGGSGSRTVDLTNVDLEQLPAYEPVQRLGQEPSASLNPSLPTVEEPGPKITNGSSSRPRISEAPTPDEPPPLYEETQVRAIEEALDDSLRKEAERRGSS